MAVDEHGTRRGNCLCQRAQLEDNLHQILWRDGRARHNAPQHRPNHRPHIRRHQRVARASNPKGHGQPIPRFDKRTKRLRRRREAMPPIRLLGGRDNPPSTAQTLHPQPQNQIRLRRRNAQPPLDLVDEQSAQQNRARRGVDGV